MDVTISLLVIQQTTILLNHQLHKFEKGYILKYNVASNREST